MLQNNQDLLSNDLEITPSIQDSLIASAKWGKFLAIMGFIGCVLIAAFGVYYAWLVTTLGAFGAAGSSSMIIMVYIIMAVVYFFPCLFLLRFSNRTMEAIRLSNQQSFESGMSNLKAMFRFMGIITIIMFFFILLAIIGLIITTNQRY